MQQAMVPPTVIERTYDVRDGASLYRRFASWLAGRGFAVQQVEPPIDGARAAEFRGGLRGERDVVLDAQRRALGRGLLIAAAVLTVVTLFVMVGGEDRYWVLDWMLTVDVLMGGVGLMLLRRPPNRQRTVVEIAMEGHGDGLRVEVREGVGQVEEDVIYRWVEGAPVEIEANDIDELVANTDRSEARA